MAQQIPKAEYDPWSDKRNSLARYALLLPGGEVSFGPHIQLPAAQGQGIEAILKERAFQDEKFGPGSKHTIGEWLLIMDAELQEAMKALVKGGTGRDSVLMEIVQVAAVALACLEQHGVQEVGRMQPIVGNKS